MSTQQQTSIREAFATEVRVALARKNRSAAWLAREAGKPQAWISARLTGRIALDVDDLELIAKTLDVSLGELLEGINKRRP